jgi:hypothetical protein
MEQARTTLLRARNSAQYRNYQQLTLELMQTLQPWGVTTDVKELPLTRSDTNIFEQFWRAFYDKRARDEKGEYTTPFSEIKRWILVLCAAIHSADLGKDFLPLAKEKCSHVASAVDAFLLELDRRPGVHTPPPPAPDIVILPGGASPNAVRPQRRAIGHPKLHLVEPPQE